MLRRDDVIPLPGSCRDSGTQKKKWVSRQGAVHTCEAPELWRDGRQENREFKVCRSYTGSSRLSSIVRLYLKQTDRVWREGSAVMSKHCFAEDLRLCSGLLRNLHSLTWTIQAQTHTI